MHERDGALGTVRHLLRCPLCAGVLTSAAAALVCPRRHTFNVAREGYVNLLTGRAPAGTDTADMVAARMSVLKAGHFDFLTAAVADLAARVTDRDREPGLVVDVGAGTGHYLAAVLDRLSDHRGLALDVARPAIRQAARAHARAAAAVCDIWRGLPVVDGCADVVLDIFAPRNGAEFRRALRHDGALIVVTPCPDHLGELVDALGLIGVDVDKSRRLDAALGTWFRREHHATATHRLILTRGDAAALVAMGPSAWHVDAARVASTLAEMPDLVHATAQVDLHLYRPAFGDQVDRSTSSQPGGGA